MFMPVTVKLTDKIEDIVNNLHEVASYTYGPEHPITQSEMEFMLQQIALKKAEVIKKFEDEAKKEKEKLKKQ